MQRDIDLVRKILLGLEMEKTSPEMVELEVKGHPQPEVHHHLTVMMEAGLIYGQEFSHERVNDTIWMYVRLTWRGHELLDAARDDARWADLKDRLQATGGSWTLAIVEELLAASMRADLGLGDPSR